MNRLQLSSLAGLTLLALGTLSMGTRPTLNAQQPPAALSAALVGGAFGGSRESGTDDGPKPDVVYVPEKPMSLEATRVWLKLQERIPMEFPDPMSLGDVLKYVQSKTIDPAFLPDGIPIYADPVGLQDADKTLASTISMNLKGIPLATTLKLALKQLSLVYRIHPDGLLYITSTESEEIAFDIEIQILNDLNRLTTEVISLRREARGTPGLREVRGGVPAPGSNQVQSNPGGFR
jgi:hypothetical protein